MESLHLRLLAPLILVAFTAAATAQEKPRDATPATRTGKERLGRKWTDEQRIDNCNVPIDRRGPKPRPSECARASGS